MKFNYNILFICLILIIGCKSKKERWVDNFCTAIEQNTHTDSIDWKQFKTAVSEAFDTSKYLAIERGLTINNNKHSFYRINNQIIKGDYEIQYNPNYCNYSSDFIRDNVPEEIGYLNIPTFITDPNLKKNELKTKSTKFINHMYDLIRMEDKKTLSGWIIDLRSNSGGNMWPMLLAIRPFLKNGVLGYFIDESNEIPWKYEKPNIFNGNMNANKRFLENSIDYKLKNNDLPLAVLIGNRTSSSGEAVAIATQAVPKMNYFGDSTSGYTTGNKTIKLAKNEFLVITGTIMANQKKKKYNKGVELSQVICDEKRLLKNIIYWIKEYGK